MAKLSKSVEKRLGKHKYIDIGGSGVDVYYRQDDVADELSRQRKEIDKGWVDYFKDKDISREMGEKAAKEYLKTIKKHE